MLIVGVTGGIGSGKTTVTDRFAKLGITIIDADVIAHEVVEPGEPGLAAIARYFGNEVMIDGRLNRSKMRELVFNDPTKKDALERILHPIIFDRMKRLIDEATAPYIILVSPLMFETNHHELCDRVLVVDVPVEIQIERATRRDKNSVQLIQKIIATQIPREERLSRANDVIDTSRPFELLDQTIHQLHTQYLALARNHR